MSKSKTKNGKARTDRIRKSKLSLEQRAVRLRSINRVLANAANKANDPLLVVISEALKRARNPLEPNGRGELVIPLPTGNMLCCGPSGDGYGGDVIIRDIDGNEIVMWTSTEWEEEPELVMGAIFGAALTSTKELLKSLRRTRVQDGCWV